MKARKIYNKLNQAVDYVINAKDKYVANPGADFSRVRKISMKETVRRILAMEGGSLNKELYDFEKTYGVSITSSAFVQQRSKISSKAFEAVFRQFNELCNDRRKYNGYRVLAVDGSDINHDRNPNSESFVISKKSPRGYNQIHLNALYDILNKTYVDAICQPRPKENEPVALIEMLQRNIFHGKNILALDRGYEGYNMIAHLLNTENLDFVLRARHGKGALYAVKDLPMEEVDEVVSFEVSTTQTKEDKLLRRRIIQIKSAKKENSVNTKTRNWDFASPYRLRFRVVRFMLSTGEYETILTSLPKEKFPLSEIKKLYHMRWGIETSFKELKYAVGAINLHCKKDDLILQEIYAALTMYNYCSRIARNAVVYKRVNAVYEYQINFTKAVQLCRLFYKLNDTNFLKLLDDIGKNSEPIRPGRSSVRNVKPKCFVGFTYRIST